MSVVRLQLDHKTSNLRRNTKGPHVSRKSSTIVPVRGREIPAYVPDGCRILQEDNTHENTHIETFRCWHDGHPHTGVPYGLPYWQNPVTGEYAIRGKFCSLSCVLGYAETRKHVSGRCFALIPSMSIEKYKVAPPCRPSSLMVLYCYEGDLSIEEWRALPKKGMVMEIVPKGVFWEKSFIIQRPTNTTMSTTSVSFSAAAAAATTTIPPPPPPLPNTKVTTTRMSGGIKRKRKLSLGGAAPTEERPTFSQGVIPMDF